MPALEEGIHARVKQLCADGDALAELQQYPQALDAYWDAYDVLPPPQTRWEAATWILSAIAEANFRGGDFVAGRDNLSVATRCPGGLGNPFLHLRLGQCQYEMGNLGRAADELARAYMGAGSEIFADDDPKYFAFLKTRLREPQGGW